MITDIGATLLETGAHLVVLVGLIAFVAIFAIALYWMMERLLRCWKLFELLWAFTLHRREFESWLSKRENTLDDLLFGD